MARTFKLLLMVSAVNKKSLVYNRVYVRLYFSFISNILFNLKRKSNSPLPWVMLMRIKSWKPSHHTRMDFQIFFVYDYVPKNDSKGTHKFPLKKREKKRNKVEPKIVYHIEYPTRTQQNIIGFGWHTQTNHIFTLQNVLVWTPNHDKL